MKKDYRAIKGFKYGTRHLVAGDVFQAKPAVGQAYVAMKMASAIRVPGKLSAPPLIVTNKASKASRKHKVDPTDQPPAVTQPQPTDVTIDEAVDQLAAARAEYQEKVGKRPFHGWDAAELRAKMAESDLADVDIADIDTVES